MAITTISDLKTALNTGARSNLFRVNLTSQLTTDENETFSYLCKAAQLPGSTLGIIEVPFAAGRRFKAAGDRTFADWTITIINDEDFVVRNAFERWMNGINSHAGNVRTGAASGPAGYTVDATVTQYGKTGDTLKTYKFVGMYPLDLAPIDLDWGSNDTIEEYAVTFAYQWWETDTTT